MEKLILTDELKNTKILISDARFKDICLYIDGFADAKQKGATKVTFNIGRDNDNDPEQILIHFYLERAETNEEFEERVEFEKDQRAKAKDYLAHLEIEKEKKEKLELKRLKLKYESGINV